MDGCTSTTNKSDRQHLPKQQLAYSTPVMKKNVTSADGLSSLRQYLLECPSISKDNEALRIALAALEEIQDEAGRSTYSSSISSGSCSEMMNTPVLSPGIKSVLMEVSPSCDIISGSSFSPKETRVNSIKQKQQRHQNQKKQEQQEQQQDNKKRTKISKSLSICQCIVRCTMIYIPLVTLFTVLILLISLHTIHASYLSPRIKLMTFSDAPNRDSENTYYERDCTASDISTIDPSDLAIHPNSTASEALHHMMTNGMSVYPDILSPDTSTRLRDYIIKRNSELTKEEAIPVIANENRWSFGIGVNDDPIVTEAVREVATNRLVRGGLEAIAGRNPALVEFTAISTAFGATDQFWHQDVLASGSALKYSRSFIPTYNLFISLQDTTAEMGATQVCPGTHVCASMSETLRSQYGFQVSGDSVWKRGDGVLMNQQSFHRGTAHTDPNAPTRVLFILTFAPRPVERGETRIIGQGGSYSLRWDMWGHTLDDLEDAGVSMVQPWAALKSMGVYKPKDADWGWTYLTQVSMRVANEDTGYSADDLEQLIDDGGIGLPAVLTPYKSVTWEAYFLSHIVLWKRIAIGVNIVTFATYLLGSIILGGLFNAIKSMVLKERVSNKPLHHTVCSIVLRLAIIYGAIILITVWALNNLSKSHWAKDIQTGRLHQPSFDIIEELPQATMRKSTLVTRNDKLISPNYDSKVLLSVGQFLDYHPGSLVFDARVRNASPLFPVLNDNDRMTVVHNLVEEATLSDNRILLQDQYGDWTILNVADSESYTGRAISLQSCPLSAALEKERISMAAYYRNGELKSTIMGRQVGPMVMNSLMDQIFEREIPYILNFEPIDPLKPGLMRTRKTEGAVVAEEKQTHIVKPLDLLHSCGPRSCFVSQQWHLGTYPLSTSTTTHMSRRSPRFKPDHTRAATSVYKASDIVEAHFDDWWYKSRIFQIRHGSLVDVMYDDGGDDYGISEERIRIYRPYAVGEIIEAGNDEDTESWQKAEIIHVVSPQIVKVRYGTGSVAKLTHVFLRRFVHHYRVGDEVACRFRGEGWYKGYIKKYNVDGTTNIRFEDGYMEYNVHPRDLRGWNWFDFHK